MVDARDDGHAKLAHRGGDALHRLAGPMAAGGDDQSLGHHGSLRPDRAAIM
jgi:hypothetical protein